MAISCSKEFRRSTSGLIWSTNGEIHHKSSDTIDKVDVHNLAAGSAVVAVTAYAIAERAEPIAPHISHAAGGELLKKAKLDDFLKALGIWN